MLRLTADTMRRAARICVPATAPRISLSCSLSLTRRFSSAAAASDATASSSASATSAASHPPSPPAATAAAPNQRAAKKTSADSEWAPLRGMHDAWPGAVSRARSLESALLGVCSTYCYSEVRTPLLERTSLFSRSLGDGSDVVSKEMFSFDDRDGTPTVLRPECTASVARAAMHAGVGSMPMPARLCYVGPMFRRERPQAGRFRQFSQVGVEMLGSGDVAADAEVITLAAECLRAARVLPYVQLQINTLGDAESRDAYTEALGSFLRARESRLSEESRSRLARGSLLRILDSKDASDQALLRGECDDDRTPAPLLRDFLTPAARARFESLLATLDSHGVRYVVNPFLVRGLDYYSHACFEFVMDEVAIIDRVKQLRAAAKASGKKSSGPLPQVPSQSAVLAGGRYDGLFETLGGPRTPAIGWAAGLERLLLLQELTQPSDLPVLARPQPIGVVQIEDEPGATQEQGAIPVAQAAAALCTFIRRGCVLQTQAAVTDESTAAASSSAPPSFLSSPPYSVVRSFHPSVGKQLKYCTRPLDFGPHTPQVQLLLLVGSEEVANQCVKIKRAESGEQTTVTLAQLTHTLAQMTGREASMQPHQGDITYHTLRQAMRQ